MRIVPCVEDVEEVVLLKNTTGEDIEVLLIWFASWQRFSVVSEVNEIARTQVKPGCTFTAIRLIAVVFQIKQMIFPLPEEWDEITSPAVGRFEEYRHNYSFCTAQIR